MSALSEVTGHCLCGGITLTAYQLSSNVDVCHCATCRKWNGGPFFATSCDRVEMTGDDMLTIYSSSEWAERGFCQQCGTHLFYRLKDNHTYILPVDFFGLDQELTLTHQIFVDEKPHYYELANQTDNLTGAEVFAQYQGDE